MEQYIDKSALVAEIEKRINEINPDSIEDWRYRLQREHDIEVMKNILSLINTLEVKEVDLDKELSYEDYIRFFEEHPNFSNDWGFDEAWSFAKYFFELGLKAQKGE